MRYTDVTAERILETAQRLSGTRLLDVPADQLMADKELTSTVETMLATLSDREATVLKLRYGLGKRNGKCMTLVQVGEELGLTRERVRQIEASAIRKLRRAHDEELLARVLDIEDKEQVG